METFKYTTHSRTILADLYTPVGVYMRLRDLYPQSALMSREGQLPLVYRHQSHCLCRYRTR